MNPNFYSDAPSERKIRCPRCKEFYNFNDGLPPNACPDCVVKREAQIQNLRDLIRENKGINAMELQRQTGIPINFIMKILNEGDIEVVR